MGDWQPPLDRSVNPEGQRQVVVPLPSGERSPLAQSEKGAHSPFVLYSRLSARDERTDLESTHSEEVGVASASTRTISTDGRGVGRTFGAYGLSISSL
jgi:hypothetical protein